MVKLITGFGIFLTGCSNIAYVAPNEAYVVNEQLRVPATQSSVGRFNAQIIFMADQIERNVDRENLDNTFIVTSFSNLNRLAETTSFGRLVAENFIHELQVRKWKIFEVRLTKDIIINETGEFSLSRDIKKIKEIYMVGGIITGTYSVANGHIIVNSRVIDINTGLVVSSAQSHMPVTWFTDALLFNADNLQPMRIVGDTPSSSDIVKRGSINMKAIDK
jgi:TolB-like protein